MTACTHSDALAPAAPFGRRLLEVLARVLGRGAVARASIDQAWIDTGLGRLDSATLVDIGAPPEAVERATLREAWKLAAALDATRHL